MIYLDKDTGDWTIIAGEATIKYFEEMLEANAKTFNCEPKMTVLQFIKKSRK